MNATETLHQLLDERGVKWHGVADSTCWGEVLLTKHDGSNPVYKFKANKIANKLSVHLLQVTPEQAVEATLGRGTCQIETTENWLPAERYHRCKECGAFFAVLDASHDIPPRYCPNCGRKIES